MNEHSARLLCGIRSPQHGAIVLLGLALGTLPGAERDRFLAYRIGFVFQMFK